MCIIDVMSMSLGIVVRAQRLKEEKSFSPSVIIREGASL